MTYMKDSTGRRLDSFKVADTKLRRRDVLGLSALPGVMTSPPTVTHGTATLYRGSVVIPPWYAGPTRS